MDQIEFYNALLWPVASKLGPFDPISLTAIVGFWAGGPVSLWTIGRGQQQPFVTYVTCEVAVHQQQLPSEAGNYEPPITSDNEKWAWTILTNVGRMTSEVAFGDGHTLDIGPWVGINLSRAWPSSCSPSVDRGQALRSLPTPRPHLRGVRAGP